MKRLFVDTNLFLRYLTNDVPEQAERVKELLEKAESGSIRLETNAMVVAELVWTMDSFYELPRNQISRNILALLNTPGLTVEGSQILLTAIVWFEEKNVDFIDAYNAAWIRANELDGVYSFDRKHFARLLPGQCLEP